MNLLNPSKRATAERVLEACAHALRENNVTATQSEYAMSTIARLFSITTITELRSITDDINNSHAFTDAAIHRYREGVNDEPISAIAAVHDLYVATLEEARFTTERRPSDIASMVFKDRLAVRYTALMEQLKDPEVNRRLVEEAAVARTKLGKGHSRRHGNVNDALSIIVALALQANPKANAADLFTSIKNKIKLGQNLLSIRIFLTEGACAALIGWKWSTV